MEDSQQNSYLTKETLVPIGLVITILGCVFWLGTAMQRLDDLERDLNGLPQRISILENRQGVSETQYSLINEKFAEIKDDIRAIQKALKIVP